MTQVVAGSLVLLTLSTLQLLHLAGLVVVAEKNKIK
jgi:hypothetical protein